MMSIARVLQIGLMAIAFVPGGTTFAQPIYVGEQEVDTSNETAIADLLDRCESLAQDTPEAATAMQFTRGNDEQMSSEDDDQRLESMVPLDQDTIPRDEDALPLSLNLDAATSSGDGAEPAGEGAGEGPDPAEDDAGEQSGQDEADLDLDAITLEACKEAGLVF